MMRGTARKATDWRRGAGALLAALALCALPAPAHAVTVYPTTLFLDGRTRTATLTLTNDGLRAEEIDIGFSFGIPVSDGSGTVRVTFLDDVPPGQPSVLPFIRAFPRRMRLEPGQTQVVRVLVQPPEGLAAGEYWGRVMVGSVGGQPPIEQQQGEIAMQINIRTVIAIGVYYRHGQVETSLSLNGARADFDGNQARLLLDLDRGGNAAAVGRIVAELLDAAGEVVASQTEAIAVHQDMLWRVDIPLPAGVSADAGYSVRYVVEARREDLLTELLPMQRLTGTVPLSMP